MDTLDRIWQYVRKIFGQPNKRNKSNIASVPNIIVVNDKSYSNFGYFFNRPSRDEHDDSARHGFEQCYVAGVGTSHGKRDAKCDRDADYNRDRTEDGRKRRETGDRVERRERRRRRVRARVEGERRGRRRRRGRGKEEGEGSQVSRRANWERVGTWVWRNNVNGAIELRHPDTGHPIK